MNKVNRQKGFSQIILLVIISFLAVALPVTIRLVQKSQENRSSAATESTYSGGGCSSYTSPSSCNAVKGCSWDGSAGLGTCRGTPVTPGVTPINGACGGTKDTCSAGTFQDATDTPDNYYWNCLGKDGGTNKYGCTAKKSSGSDGCGTGLYTCNNGVTAVKEDPVGANFKWKCGTVSCSMPFSSCAGGDRPLGCNCSLQSDCTSNTCYKQVCVASGCIHANTYIANGHSQCFNALGGLWSEMITCNSGKESVESYIGPDCVTKSGPEDCINGKYKCNGTTAGSQQSLVCKNNRWELNQACGNSGCNSSTGLCNGDNTSPVCGTSSSATQPSGSSACSVGTASGFKTTSTGWSWNCVNGNKTISCSATKTTACSSSSCSSCDTSSACTNAGCSWGYFNSSYMHCETKTDKICTANTETKCSSDSKSLMTCNSTGTGWDTTACPSGKCENKACTSNSGPGPGPGPGPDTTICTADTVSTTECYDSTHLKKCNSDGTAWIQGDQCASNQACQNGVCGGVGAKLSFKFAFDGVAPANLSCLDNFKKVTLTVGKVGTTLVQEMSADVTKTDLTNSKGYAIFGADNVALGTGFSGVTNVYVKIKGQVHARMYYCVKSQSSKNTSQICNLSLDGTVNNFYEYPVLAGDVDQNGIVNTADFSVIKTALFTTGCGVKTDLNGDGIVNEFDVKLFKVALEAKYDE